MKRVQSDGKVKGSGNMKELCKKCAEEMLENNFPTPLLLIHPYTITIPITMLVLHIMIQYMERFLVLLKMFSCV